jgi:hypothetical protein
VTLTNHAARYPWIEVASTPTGFTAITWIRYHNGRWQTVVTLRTAAGRWSREVVRGAHTDLAVGPRGTVAMAKLRLVGDGAVSLMSLRITWRNNHTEWTTDRFAPRQSVVEPVEVAVDESGWIFVTWSQRPVAGSDPDQVRGFNTIHRRVWRTTMLWGSAPQAYLRRSAVSSNGRAVAIWAVSNESGTRTTAVLMRVLRPV